MVDHLTLVIVKLTLMTVHSLTRNEQLDWIGFVHKPFVTKWVLVWDTFSLPLKIAHFIHFHVVVWRKTNCYIKRGHLLEYTLHAQHAAVNTEYMLANVIQHTQPNA